MAEAMAIDGPVIDAPVASTSALAPSPSLKRKASGSNDVADPSAARGSSRRRTRFIAEGDLVILFMSRDRPTIPLRVTPGESYVNSYGSFPHANLIGRPFGSMVRSTNNKGFITLLRPTPELWTLSLPHRTQILYAPDMSFIAMKLALSPGARVVEAGTGSGSFTHFLARTVGLNGAKAEQGTTAGRGWQGQPGMGISAPRGKGVQTRPPKSEQDAGAATTASSTSPPPTAAPTEPDYDGEADPSNGKVWTFEFHKERAARAREEFISHNLTPLVSSSHRNVCLHGFPSSINGQADALFLDLPAPWEAIPYAPAVLNSKQTTRICCFSPCIEQVLRTVKALNEHGFKDVEMYESLVRTHESIRPSVMEMPLKKIEDVQERLKGVLKKKEKITEWQKKRSREKKEKEARVGAQDGDEDAGIHDDGDDGDDGDDAAADVDIADAKNGGADDDGGADDKEDILGAAASDVPQVNAAPTHPHPQYVPIGTEAKKTQYMIKSNVYSRSHPQMRGHTSYLTFASLLPRDPEVVLRAGLGIGARRSDEGADEEQA